MGCNCKKIGKTMSRRSKSFETEDLLYAGLGALAGLALNPIINKAVANQPEGTRNMIGTALPVVKGGVGAYLATQQKQNKKLRFIGLGMVATGALELGVRAKPDLFSISGTGDVYRAIGSPVVTYPIATKATMEEDRDEMGLVQEPILGTKPRSVVI